MAHMIRDLKKSVQQGVVNNLQSTRLNKMIFDWSVSDIVNYNFGQ